MRDSALRGRLLALCLLIGSLGCRSMVEVPRERPTITPLENGKTSASAFFRDPVLSRIALSPSGRRIAAVGSRGGVEVVFVRPAAGGEIKMLAKLDRDRRNQGSWRVRTVGWGNEDEILVGLEMPSPHIRRVRARQSRLMVVDAATGDVRYLGKKWRHQQYSFSQDGVLNFLPWDPEHILIEYWRPGDPGVGAYQVDLRSGALTTVARPRGQVFEMHADSQGRVRVAEGRERDGRERFLLGRKQESDRFEELQRADPYEDSWFSFAGFSSDPSVLYVWSDAATGRRALYEYDLEARRIGSELFSHPEVDLDGLHIGADGTPEFVSFETDRPQRHFLDSGAARRQRAFDRALPGTFNRVVSRSMEGHVEIVEVSSDVVPPSYYLVDSANKTASWLFDAYPELQGLAFAPMKAIRLEARDGTRLRGYLTLPPGVEPSGLPAIVMPHGGPWARDRWGWDPVLQFLVSRGFAVLQLNYRGSSGYGSEHLKKGFGQWGLSMQDDLSDGTRWLIDEGIADPHRIGIFGSSYGGYAALQGLVREPELYAAGASQAGVTDLVGFVADDQAYLFGPDIEYMIGEAWGDRAALAAVSPARHADRIRVPVLVAHGEQDPRVHIRQAHRMVDALESAAVPVEALLYPDEGHGFIDERNRIHFYDRLADFFERHLLREAQDPSSELP